MQLNCSANSHGVKIKSPPHSAAASYTLTLPNNDGNADQVLQTNGSGVLTWVDAATAIAAKAIAISKLADGTDGELITWDASGEIAAVAAGAAAQVLTSNGAGAAPTFQAASSGGGTSIASLMAYGAL